MLSSIYFQTFAGWYVLLSDIEPIMEKIFLNEESLLSTQISSDADDPFCTSEMEVKLFDFFPGENKGNSLDGCALGFFLKHSRVFCQRSVPFRRIIGGRDVIETLSMVSPNASKNIKVEIGKRYNLLDDQQ